MVVSTPAGTKVPIAFCRNAQRQMATLTVEELTLEEGEQQGRAGHGTAPGFGVSLGDLTPAAEAGLQRGDVILEVNRQAVHSASDASRFLRQAKSGQTAFLLLSRHGNQVLVELRRE
jgi:S1-C subfamily serine protease